MINKLDSNKQFDTIMLFIAMISFITGNFCWVALNMIWIDPYFETFACLTLIYWLCRREQTFSKIDYRILLCSTILICCFVISTKKFVPFFGIFRWCFIPTSADTMGILRVLLMIQGLLRSDKNDFSFAFATNLLIMVVDEMDGTVARACNCNTTYGDYVDHSISDKLMSIYPVVLAHFAYPKLDPLWWGIIIRNNVKEEIDMTYFKCIPLYGWGSPMYSLTVVGFVRLWTEGFPTKNTPASSVISVRYKSTAAIKGGKNGKKNKCSYLVKVFGQIAWFFVLTAPLINPLMTEYTIDYAGGCSYSLGKISKDFFSSNKYLYTQRLKMHAVLNDTNPVLPEMKNHTTNTIPAKSVPAFLPHALLFIFVFYLYFGVMNNNKSESQHRAIN